MAEGIPSSQREVFVTKTTFSIGKGRSFPLIFSGLMIFFFIIATFSTAGMALKPIGLSIQASGWDETPAVITSHHVDTRENQYSIKATYNYTWGNENYTGNRVFFDESVGLRKTYYRRIYRQFSKHRTASNPIMIWVNPKAPQQAVIFRHIRWDKFAFACFFCLCFAAMGFGPLWVWWTDRRDKKSEL